MAHRLAIKRGGQIYPLLAIGMLALVASTAMIIDLGILVAAKQQLQAAADAAALAGVAMLQTTLDDQAAAQAALQMASQNTILGKPLTLDPEKDIIVGAYNKDTGEITPFYHSPDGAVIVPDGPVAVKVIARRTPDSPDGPVPVFFSRMFNLGTASLVASATAGLTISHRPRPPVEVIIVQDQSGAFEDEFPYAREGDAELVRFLRDAYQQDDRTGFIGFTYHPYHAYRNHPSRWDTWTYHNYHLHSNEDTQDGAQQTIDYIESVETIPHYRYPQRYAGTNLYTGMLKAAIGFATEQQAQQLWQQFVNRLYYNGKLRDIGWWRRYHYTALKRKIRRMLNRVVWENPDARHVVVIVSDGMPWYHLNDYPDWRSKKLCLWIADRMAEMGIRIHTVTLCQNDQPPDGSAGADAQYMAKLVRNGGYAFYTYDARRLADVLVGVGQVEVGEARLIQ